MTGAHERFRMLYELHRDAVYRYALRRVGPDSATDVVSEVFLVAWRRLGEVPANPLPWLYGVARRVVANQRRGDDRYRRLAERLITAAPAVVSGADTPEADVITATSVAKAFAHLSAEDQEVLGLVVWEGLSARAAAAALGCGVPAMTMRMHRARRRLRCALAAQEATED